MVVTAAVPPLIRAALDGSAEIGSWDPFFPLITVDADGFARVCLLGRAELAADESHVCAVLAGTRTPANLRAHGRATLMVVGPDEVAYCALRTDGDPVLVGGLTGVRFTVAGSRIDTAGVALTPPCFEVGAELVESERWSDCARLLRRLRY